MHQLNGCRSFWSALTLVSTAWKALQVAKDAQAARHRNVDQPVEDL